MKDSERSTRIIFYEFQYKSLIETVSLLSKGVTYYFTILAVFGGYLYTAKLTLIEQKTIVTIAVIISLFFLIILVAIGYGVLLGALDMFKSLRTIDKLIFRQLELERYCTRGIKVGVVVIVSCIFILFAVVAGLSVKYLI